MWKQNKIVHHFPVFPICLILVLGFACADEARYIGTYKPTKDAPPEFAEFTVELKKGGQGTRRFRGQEVHFEWEVKGDELRVHTKEGGILVARVRNDLLEFTLPGLPGPETRYLKKVK